MAKKIIGYLFVIAAFVLVGTAAINGTLFKDYGTVAVTYGRFLGTILPVVFFGLSGWFMITFDDATKFNRLVNFKKRGKQATLAMVFIVVYFVSFMITCYSIGLAGIDDPLRIVALALPYFVPFTIFIFVYLMYCAPYKASKKYFLKNDAEVNEYISENETFVSYTSDNFVMASDKALFFPGLSCVVPFDQIASVQLIKQLWEQDVYFYLQNGKKFYVITKHFETIKKLVEDKKSKS